MGDMIHDLRYRSYAYNREQGMSAAAAARVFGVDAIEFEERFQQELAELAERVAMAGHAVGEHFRPASVFRSQASRGRSVH